MDRPRVGGARRDGVLHVDQPGQKQLVDRVHAALRPHGVTIIENSCLINLAMSDEHRQPLSRIAERLLIGPGRCNYVINSLEERGLVRREPHPSDRRITLAVATDAGLRLVEAANRDLAAIRSGSVTSTERRSMPSSPSSPTSATGDPVAHTRSGRGSAVGDVAAVRGT